MSRKRTVQITRLSQAINSGKPLNPSDWEAYCAQGVDLGVRLRDGKRGTKREKEGAKMTEE